MVVVELGDFFDPTVISRVVMESTSVAKETLRRYGFDYHMGCSSFWHNGSIKMGAQIRKTERDLALAIGCPNKQ